MIFIDDFSKTFIKKTEAQKIFSVSQSQLSKWIKEGNLHSSMRGYCKLDEVFEYWKFNKQNVESLDVNKDENDQDDMALAEIKRQIQSEILKEKKINNKKLKGELLEKKDVLSAWINRLSDLKQGLLNLKSRLSTKCALKSQTECAEVIEKEVDQIFINFSRDGKFCKKED